MYSNSITFGSTLGLGNAFKIEPWVL